MVYSNTHVHVPLPPPIECAPLCFATTAPLMCCVIWQSVWRVTHLLAVADKTPLQHHGPKLQSTPLDMGGFSEVVRGAKL